MWISTIPAPEFNKLDINDFRAAEYFPPEYEIWEYGFIRTDEEKSALLSSEAPGWVLQSADDQAVSLEDITLGVILAGSFTMRVKRLLRVRVR